MSKIYFRLEGYPYGVPSFLKPSSDDFEVVVTRKFAERLGVPHEWFNDLEAPLSSLSVDEEDLIPLCRSRNDRVIRLKEIVQSPELADAILRIIDEKAPPSNVVFLSDLRRTRDANPRQK
ncbi:hypothetical protein ACQR3P_29070 [Rhodococcus sp. IEGM1300]